MSNNPNNFNSGESRREKSSIFGGLTTFLANNFGQFFEKPIEIYDLDRKQAENCGFAYLLQYDEYVLNSSFDKAGKYRTDQDRLSLEERKSINFADFKNFQIIVSLENSSVYFRVSNQKMVLETGAIGYFERPEMDNGDDYQKTPLSFRGELLVEHRESVGKILQRPVLENTNPNFQPGTIAQENARIAQIMLEIEGKTNEQILDEAAEKYGID